MNEAEQYFENTEDIINEEDLEESVCESRKQSPVRQSLEKVPTASENFQFTAAEEPKAAVEVVIQAEEDKTQSVVQEAASAQDESREDKPLISARTQQSQKIEAAKVAASDAEEEAKAHKKNFS